MTVRIFQLLCCVLTLAACDESKKSAQESADEPNNPRVTKSHRSPPEVPLKPRDQLLAAFQQAEEMSVPEEKNRALAAAIWDALELEPELARQGLQKLTAGSEEKNRLIQHFAMRLTEQNVDEAVQWATALETEEEKSQAFGKIALVLSATEPEQAAHLLSDSGVAGREFDVAVVQVVQRWAAQAPAAAAAWVIRFDEGEARRAGTLALPPRAKRDRGGVGEECSAGCFFMDRGNSGCQNPRGGGDGNAPKYFRPTGKRPTRFAQAGPAGNAGRF